MYPFSSDVFAARNQWYVAAFSKEVTRAPIERWLLDEPVALYRTNDGDVVALEGRCAHRHFPLAEGKLVGDDLQCPYHGFTYSKDGHCIRVPSQDRAPRNCKIKSYPVVEQWRWIWIWMGDPTLADPSIIPDHGEIGLKDPALISDEVLHEEISARYQLVHDNLMDLTHVAFLHRNTLGGGSDAAASATITQAEGPDWMEGERVLRDIITPPHFAGYLGYSGPADRTIGQRFYLPALHYGWDRYTYPRDHPKVGNPIGTLLVYHGITPGRRHTTHYFFATARSFGKEAQEEMRAATSAVIQEDVWGLSHVERMLQTYGGTLPPEFSARSDTQQLLARRRMEKLIVDEQQQTGN